MVEHKTRKNQHIFYKCNICNNKTNITLYCITMRKAANRIRNIINVVDGQGLAKNSERQIQGQTNFGSTFIMLKKIRDNEFCDVTLASVDSQKS